MPHLCAFGDFETLFAEKLNNLRWSPRMLQNVKLTIPVVFELKKRTSVGGRSKKHSKIKFNVLGFVTSLEKISLWIIYYIQVWIIKYRQSFIAELDV